jgi:hypothetical protein
LIAAKVSEFGSVREAKQFVISRIVEEAQQEGTPLSEPERKLLYESAVLEPARNLAEASEDFDTPSRQDQYERRIAGLIRSFDRRARKERSDEWVIWWDAIQLLKKHDNYVVVMIDRARLSPPGDFLRLWATGLAIVSLILVVIFLAIFVADNYKNHLPSGKAFGFYIWTTVACVAVGYGLIRWILGAERLDNLSDRVSKKLFGFWRL